MRWFTVTGFSPVVALLTACSAGSARSTPSPSADPSARALAVQACDGFAASGQSSTAAQPSDPDGGGYNALVEPVVTAGQAAGLDPRWQRLVNALTAYQARAAAGDEPDLQAEAFSSVQAECDKTAR